METLIATVVGGLIGVGATLIGVIVQARIAREGRETQFRLAAIDKRLIVHQEAFAYWIKILWNLHNEEISKIASDAQDWWINNCLYLEPKARSEFRRAFLTAPTFRHIDDPNLRRITMDEITAVGNVISEGVSLPPIGDLSKEEIKAS